MGLGSEFIRVSPACVSLFTPYPSPPPLRLLRGLWRWFDGSFGANHTRVICWLVPVRWSRWWQHQHVCRPSRAGYRQTRAAAGYVRTWTREASSPCHARIIMQTLGKLNSFRFYSKVQLAAPAPVCFAWLRLLCGLAGVGMEQGSHGGGALDGTWLLEQGTGQAKYPTKGGAARGR